MSEPGTPMDPPPAESTVEGSRQLLDELDAEATDYEEEEEQDQVTDLPPSVEVVSSDRRGTLSPMTQFETPVPIVETVEPEEEEDGLEIIEEETSVGDLRSPTDQTTPFMRTSIGNALNHVRNPQVQARAMAGGILSGIQALRRTVGSPTDPHVTIRSRTQEGGVSNQREPLAPPGSTLGGIYKTPRNSSSVPVPAPAPAPTTTALPVPKVAKTKTTPGSTASISSQANIGGFLRCLPIRTTVDLDDILAKSNVTISKADRNSMSKERRYACDAKATARVLPVKGLLDEVSYSSTDPNVLENTAKLADKLQTLKQALQAYDMLDVFYVQEFVDVLSSHRTKSAKVYDLFEDFLQLTPELVAESNYFYRVYVDDEAFNQDLTLSATLLQNNCTPGLWANLQADLNSIHPAFHGGPLLFYLAISRIQNPSQAAITHILETLRKIKITDYDGENVEKVVQILRSSHTLLLNASLGGINYVPDDFDLTILKILQTSSVPAFNGLFADELKTYTASSVIKRRQAVHLTPDELFEAANGMYRQLLATNEWHIPRKKHKHSVFIADDGTIKLICDNCGKEGHSKPNCPEQIDEERCKRNREKRLKAARARNGNPRRTGNPRQHPRRDKNTNTSGGDNHRPKRGDTRANTATGKHEIYSKKGKWVLDNAFYAKQQREVLSHIQEAYVAGGSDVQAFVSGLTTPTQSTAGTTVSSVQATPPVPVPSTVNTAATPQAPSDLSNRLQNSLLGVFSSLQH